MSIYSKLVIEMMRKGLTLKQKHMKMLIHPIYENLLRNWSCTKELFKEMVVNSPGIMFQNMQGEILNENLQPILIEFISENSEIFINHSDMRSFLTPFLHLLCSTKNGLEMKHKTMLDVLFQQMVEVSGE